MMGDLSDADHNPHYILRYHKQIQYHLYDKWTNALMNLMKNQN